MIPVFTAAETRELDRRTEAAGKGVEELMERAGWACAATAREVAGGASGRRAVAVCGKGNNGGDALVAARVLESWGMRTTAVLLAPPEDLRGPAAANLRRLEDRRIRSIPFARETLERELDRADVAVDGLFGSGFRGVAEGPSAEAIEALNRGSPPVVAVDVPSGVEGDTGAVPGPAVRAAVTVTFGGPKVGDVLYPGAEHAGRVVVADIGFPEELLHSDLLLMERADVRVLLPRRVAEDHKHRSGDVLVVAGSRRMSGAPRLVAEGAIRAGAGLVHVAVPEGILPAVQGALQEAVFVPLPEGATGAVVPEAWDVLREAIDRFDAIAVGPGLSADDDARSFVRRLVHGSPVPVVVDADAIGAFAGRPGDLADRAAEAVVTPHAGEFARLVGMPVAAVAEDRVGLVRKAAREVHGVVLLKGPRTLVAAPSGTVWINPTGSPALASGGTGDVLTGIVATYLARGVAPADAAGAAAYVHGRAGELAGRSMGEGAGALGIAAAVPGAVLEVVRG